MKGIFPTEIGLLSIWNSNSFLDVDSKEKYLAIFVEDKSILEQMNAGKAVVWGTGGDGSFSITVKINPDSDLTDDEKTLVEAKVLDLNIVIDGGNLCVGSPEGVGTIEKKLLAEEVIQEIEGIDQGKYLVNIYFLFDTKFMEMEKAEAIQILESNPDADKTGYVVTLKRVDEDYIFPRITELPQLG